MVCPFALNTEAIRFVQRPRACNAGRTNIQAHHQEVSTVSPVGFTRLSASPDMTGAHGGASYPANGAYGREFRKPEAATFFILLLESGSRVRIGVRVTMLARKP